MSTRIDSPSQPKKLPIHDSHAGNRVGRLVVVEGFQRSVLIVRSVARLGSAFTASSARAISARLRVPLEAAGPDCAAAADVYAPARRATPIAARAQRSMRERTPELLLDVPGLELGPPVQIHAEARGDVEGLEEEHGGRVTHRQREHDEARQLARDELVEPGAAPLRREPEDEREDRDRQRALAEAEGGRHHRRRTQATAADLRDARAAPEDREALELVDRFGQRAPRRQPPDRPRERELPPPD